MPRIASSRAEIFGSAWSVGLRSGTRGMASGGGTCRRDARSGGRPTEHRVELESHRALGMTLLWRGMIVRAREHLEEGRRLYDPEQHRIHAFRYGNDPGVACLVHEAFALWVLGYA